MSPFAQLMEVMAISSLDEEDVEVEEKSDENTCGH